MIPFNLQMYKINEILKIMMNKHTIRKMFPKLSNNKLNKETLRMIVIYFKISKKYIILIR